MQSSPNTNYEQLHTFIKGWQTDKENHAEVPETYYEGWNGRLVSEQGVLSFASLSGTMKVYENEDIKKYLGWYAFKDELICFVKCKNSVTPPNSVQVTITEIVVDNFTVIADPTSNEITGLNIFDGHWTYNQVTVPVVQTVPNPDDFNQNVSCADPDNTIDDTYGGLFQAFPFLPSVVCSIYNNDVPINNQTYTDGIISFTYDSDGMLAGNFIYVGNLNFPWDAKICTEGVHENNQFKRVYFTDYHNNFRVVNLRDRKLSSRQPAEFNLQVTGAVLNPRIKSINNNGQLPASTIFYVMRLVTENGQVSDYSSTSQPARISAKDNGYEFRGGGIRELTNKSVSIDCYLPDFQNFYQVELVAVIYEAKNTPTSIVLVGRKPAAFHVEFEHFGSEQVFASNITLADIFNNSISWKYASDVTTKNNRLYASALRNDPSYSNSKNMAVDFALHGFKQDGTTHHCLLNPDPISYNFIDADMDSPFMYVKRKLFREILAFGSFTLKFMNTLTGAMYSTQFNSIANSYIDYTQAIGDFVEQCTSDVNFSTNFPNLQITRVDKQILFEPINTGLTVDFYHYSLIFSTSQVIMDMDNDLDLLSYPWPATNSACESRLVYGGVSNGYFSGNGVRVTMHSEKKHVLTKNVDWMDGAGPILQLEEPSLIRYVMKDEIYRIAINWFKNGNRLFATVLGDLKIPAVGMPKRELDANGQIIMSSEVYENRRVIGNKMYAEGIKLQFDVRINCELSKEVDSYQVVYVKRDEVNRSILAQGISAPLERIIPFSASENVDIKFDDKITNCWSLPSHGGPVYDYQGLLNYDANPSITEMPDASFGTNPYLERVITSRKTCYFDAPDIIYENVSDQFAKSSKFEFIETLATDHDRFNILGGYNEETVGQIGTKIYSADGSSHQDLSFVEPFGLPKFSQKIPSGKFSGTENNRPWNINVSIFSVSLKKRDYTRWQQIISPGYQYDIDAAKKANTGEVLSAFQLNDTFDISNNALTLSSHGWFYQYSARLVFCEKFTLFEVNNIATGRDTMFFRTKNNLFTDANIAQTPYRANGQVNFGATGGRSDRMKCNDAYIVANLKRNNEASLYGGRSEFAYSSNQYIPMSDVMPVIRNRITSQTFYVEGDTYCTLYLRNKASFIGSKDPEEIGFQWSRKANKANRKYQYNRYNGWCYGVVLETTVEPRLNHAEEFYRLTSGIGMKYDELYNSAYSQENDLKIYIPPPYNFRDDPILDNIVAASEVKLSGDFIDNWTRFLTNEFHELDKNKGAALNICKDNDTIYVIQELQTSKLNAEESSFITPDEGGKAIQIGQGNGKSISGHEVLSQFGTSIRRAIADSDFGFIFYDERKNEIIKGIDPLLTKNSLSFELKKFFKDNKVIDAEGYMDFDFKETNLRLRTESGINFVISYNEALQCFNGKFAYDNDIYAVFQNMVFAPYGSSAKIGQLNAGPELEFFEQEVSLLLGVSSAPQYPNSKIVKGIGVLINTNYPIFKTIFETSSGQLRAIMGNHHWYKQREGMHTLPAKNMSDWDDLRGEWCNILLEVKKQNNLKIKIFSIINFVRNSYK